MLPYVVSKFNNKYVICRRFERVTVLATDTTTANLFYTQRCYRYAVQIIDCIYLYGADDESFCEKFIAHGIISLD